MQNVMKTHPTHCYFQAFLIGCTLLLGCSPDIPLAKQITQHLNTDFLALQCDRTDYVVMDTFGYFDMRKLAAFGYKSPETKTTWKTEDFKFSIESIFEINETSSKDTLILNEFVGDYVAMKRIRIQPKNAEATVKVFLTVVEDIREQATPKILERPYQDYERWLKNSVRWHGSLQVALEDSTPGFYRMGWHEDFFENIRKRRFALRDTFAHFESEGGGNTATMIYRGRPCIYRIDQGILEIVIQNPDGSVSRRWIVINYSYGC
jgi:hypothetical protein